MTMRSRQPSRLGEVDQIGSCRRATLRIKIEINGGTKSAFRPEWMPELDLFIEDEKRELDAISAVPGSEL